MIKYHINPETGRANICRAEVKACPIGGEHYFDKKFAQEAAANALAEFYGGNFKKSSKLDFSSYMLNEEEALKQTLKLYEENKALMAGLSKEEAHALRFYSFTGSGEMNRLLNGKVDERLQESDQALILKHVSLLDQIIARQECSEPRRLFRSLIVPKGQTPATFVKSLTETGVYSEKGFMSTTEDPSFIAGYAHKWRNKKFIMLSIETSRGISLQSEEKEKEGNIQSFEKERLLARDSKFIVENIDKTVLRVDASRETLRKQFAGWGYEDWASGTLRIRDITPKNLLTVSLKEL